MFSPLPPSYPDEAGHAVEAEVQQVWIASGVGAKLFQVLEMYFFLENFTKYDHHLRRRQ